MHTRMTALAVALAVGVTACRSRDPEIRDSPSTALAQASSDTAAAVPAAADSAFVPNDQPAAPATQPQAESAPKKDSTPATTIKPPVKTVASPAKVTAPVDSTPKVTLTDTATKTSTKSASTTAGNTTTTVPVATPPAPVVVPAPAAVAATAVKPVLPFAPGEQLEYQVKFGSVSVGKAVMEVIGIDTIRGIPALHIRLRVEGKLAFVSVKDLYESWIDTRTMSSLRYTQDIDEANYERERHYEIYPERKTYHEQGKKELPSVAAPLDDASFLFFLRTIPLVVGQTLSFDRYFKPDRNPVKASVMRKERITVPAGKFETIVVRPVIKTSGLFSEGGRAEAWFADDESRILVQLKTQMKVGSLNLFLRKIKRAPGTPPTG